MYVYCTLQIEECVVCSDKKAAVLFQPCGHMCACESKQTSRDVLFETVLKERTFESKTKQKNPKTSLGM